MSTTTAKTKTKSVKRRERNSKRVKDKMCIKCNQNITENEKRDMLMSHDTYHQLQAKDYCKDHAFTYSGHKCKPIWCSKCRYLINYEITIDVDKK